MLGKSVLVIDDNSSFIELLKYNLEKENIPLKVRRSKYYDMKELDLSDFDLVVSDFYLPGTNGIELCKKIKCSPTTEHAVFILLAHEFDQVDFKTALDSGVDDFFMKPVRIMSLIKSIKTLIKMNQPEENHHLNKEMISLVENVTIDNNSYRVYIEDEPVDLNLIEFNLFKLFLCNPDKIFTYGQLYLEMNAFGFILGIHSINFQIDLLRKKLSRFKFQFRDITDVGFKLVIP
jgi:DNA-binding response OmpR family regulator